eukprot:357835-Chlamydomonas_euryale.AAC.6
MRTLRWKLPLQGRNLPFKGGRDGAASTHLDEPAAVARALIKRRAAACAADAAQCSQHARLWAAADAADAAAVGILGLGRRRRRTPFACSGACSRVRPAAGVGPWRGRAVVASAVAVAGVVLRVGRQASGGRDVLRLLRTSQPRKCCLAPKSLAPCEAGDHQEVITQPHSASVMTLHMAVVCGKCEQL